LQPVTQIIAPADTDANAICQSQTPTGANAMTLNGVLVASGTTYAQLPAQQYVTITCAGNDAGRTFTLVAEGRTGQRFTFTQAGANIGATTSTIGPYRVISVTPDAATAGAIEVGIVGQGRQYPVIIDTQQNPCTISVSAVVSGTIDYTVQHSFNDPFADGNPDTWTWINIDDNDMVTATTTQNSNYAFPPRAIAILINSVTAPGAVTFRVIQSTNAPS
jgi:hypothetical protein